jgi:hypothetical protein
MNNASFHTKISLNGKVLVYVAMNNYILANRKYYRIIRNYCHRGLVFRVTFVQWGSCLQSSSCVRAVADPSFVRIVSNQRQKVSWMRRLQRSKR